MEAVKQNVEAIKYASIDLTYNKKFILDIVKQIRICKK